MRAAAAVLATYDGISIAERAGSHTDGGFSARFPCPPGATHLLVSLRDPDACTCGTFIRVAAFPEGTHEAAPTEAMLGRSTVDVLATALLPVAGCPGQVVVTFHPAFAGATLTLSNMHIELLAAQAGTAIPIGASGAIFTGPETFPAAVREVIDHYAHYRQSAQGFAIPYYAWHNALSLVRTLVDGSRQVNATG